MKRRDFMKWSLGGTLAATISSGAEKDSGLSMPTRKYNEEVSLSIIGFGGIIVVRMAQSDANDIVALSVDRGVNYFDVAPSYGDGEAEIKLGKSLESHRKKVFLACKTLMRDKKGAVRELERSLGRLHTDYFDLYQFHAVSTMEDVEAICAPGGALEAFIEARESGKIKYIGFSAHSEQAALALMDKFKFDSILFPVNFVCYSSGNFGPGVIHQAEKLNVARLALKMMAYSPWPEEMNRRKWPKCWYRPVDEKSMVEKAMRFTLSEPVTAAIPPGEAELYLLALDMAPGIKELSQEERSALLSSVSDVRPLFST